MSSTAPVPATGTASPAPPRRPASAGLMVLMALPVLVHVALLALSFFDQDHQYISFEHLDFAFLLVLVAYVLAAMAAAASRTVALRFVLLVYAALAALGVVEGVARVLLPASPAGLPHAPRRFSATVGDHVPGLSGLTYTYSVNALGLRGPEVNLEDMDLRILCVGGSTTECVIVPDEKTWPWRLQDKLADRLGQKVFVGNAGISGQHTLHHAYQIEHYAHMPEFDWVILMCGMNDMGLVKNSGSLPTDADTIAGEALTPILKHRFYYRHSGLVRLTQRVLALAGRGRTIVQDGMADWLRLERAKREKAFETGDVVDEVSDADMTVWCDEYRANLLAVIHACRERRVKLLMLTQATLYRKDLPRELQKLLFSVNPDGTASSLAYLEKVITAYNRTMVRLCRAEGIAYLDLDAQLPKDTTVFFDDCHFNLTGCERVADILADFFVRKGRRAR